VRSETGEIGAMLEDPLFWILVLPGLLLGSYAQWRIRPTLPNILSSVTKDGITGAQVAQNKSPWRMKDNVDWNIIIGHLNGAENLFGVIDVDIAHEGEAKERHR
jgi:hypothetical protein